MRRDTEPMHTQLTIVNLAQRRHRVALGPCSALDHREEDCIILMIYYSV